jgi:hypothetical protein
VFDNSLIQYIIDEYVQCYVPENRLIVCEILAGETARSPVPMRIDLHFMRP